MEGEKKVNEYDRFLPIANIGRIIRDNLPPEVKLSKEAKEIFQECASEFISFITSEASDKCNADKRKTMNGDDILQAMKNLGFDKYIPILKIYLEKVGIACPKCGSELVLRRTKKGRVYYGCIGYPECDFMSWQKPKA